MNQYLRISAYALSIILTNLAFGAAIGQFNGNKRAEPSETEEIRGQIEQIEDRIAQLPDRAASLYLLSTLKQRLGETSESINLLRQCLAFNEGFDPAGSPSLRVLRGSKRFDGLVRRVHRAFPPVRRAHLAFATTEDDLVPEGLAFDSRQRVFYLSSLNRKKIVKISSDGSISDFVSSDRYSLLPVLGIRVDPRDSSVWAASWSEDAGTAELLHFGPTGALLGRFAPQDAKPHGFNDLVLLKDGGVVLTDTVSNEVYHFYPISERFESLSVCRALSAPNGIAISDDARELYIADDFGVVRINLDLGTSIDVMRAPHSTLAGIDGIYWHDGSLIAIQNGIGSARIISFRLSHDGSRVIASTVLENRSTFTVSPTTGAIVGSDLYFIANAQGDNLSGDRVINRQKLERVRIGMLGLP